MLAHRGEANLLRLHSMCVILKLISNFFVLRLVHFFFIIVFIFPSSQLSLSLLDSNMCRITYCLRFVWRNQD